MKRVLSFCRKEHAMPLLERVTDFHAGAEIIRRRRYGVIEMANGGLVALHLRPWPKLISLGEIWLHEMLSRRARKADRCLLYYDQPLRFPKYLALKYVVSSRGATFRTVRGAALVLDEIARIKQIDAIVTNVWNRRISERLLRRWGWERHLLQSRRRHYIKRFYESRERSDESREPNVNGDREPRNSSGSPLSTLRSPLSELALPQGGTQDYYPAPFAPAHHERKLEEMSPCDAFQGQS
jgi:hypothetical protein